jgi:hypothetical protein
MVETLSMAGRGKSDGMLIRETSRLFVGPPRQQRSLTFDDICLAGLSLSLSSITTNHSLHSPTTGNLHPIKSNYSSFTTRIDTYLEDRK